MSRRTDQEDAFSLTVTEVIKELQTAQRVRISGSSVSIQSHLDDFLKATCWDRQEAGAKVAAPAEPAILTTAIERASKSMTAEERRALLLVAECLWPFQLLRDEANFISREAEFNRLADTTAERWRKVVLHLFPTTSDCSYD